MSNELCHPYSENLAAYAIGTLDADEIPALESHLETCQYCQSELAAYQSVSIGLLQAASPQTPPPKLRRKLVAHIPSQHTRTSTLLAKFFGQFPLGQVTVATLVAIMLGLNIFSSMRIHDLQQQQAAIDERLSNEQAAIAMLAYPNTQTLAISTDVMNLTGSMLVDKDKSMAVLVLWNVPQLELGQTYQIWLIDVDGRRTSGGLFTPILDQAYTTTTIHSPVSIGQFKGVGVTVEPEGGSEGPTGPRILAVDL